MFGAKNFKNTFARPHRKSVAKTIRQEQKHQGLTDGKMAETLGIKRGTYSSIKTEKKPISNGVRHAFFYCYGYDPDPLPHLRNIHSSKDTNSSQLTRSQEVESFRLFVEYWETIELLRDIEEKIIVNNLKRTVGRSDHARERISATTVEV